MKTLWLSENIDEIEKFAGNHDLISGATMQWVVMTPEELEQRERAAFEAGQDSVRTFDGAYMQSFADYQKGEEQMSENKTMPGSMVALQTSPDEIARFAYDRGAQDERAAILKMIDESMNT